MDRIVRGYGCGSWRYSPWPSAAPPRLAPPQRAAGSSDADASSSLGSAKRSSSLASSSACAGVTQHGPGLRRMVVIATGKLVDVKQNLHA